MLLPFRLYAPLHSRSEQRHNTYQGLMGRARGLCLMPATTHGTPKVPLFRELSITRVHPLITVSALRLARWSLWPLAHSERDSWRAIQLRGRRRGIGQRRARSFGVCRISKGRDSSAGWNGIRTRRYGDDRARWRRRGSSFSVQRVRSIAQLGGRGGSSSGRIV
jgi:hypothetical protein